MGRDRSLTSGDLVEVRATKSKFACIVRLNGDGSFVSSYVPTSIVGVWLGREFIDLGIDKVELEIFLHEGQRHALIVGEIKKIR